MNPATLRKRKSNENNTDDGLFRVQAAGWAAT